MTDTDQKKRADGEPMMVARDMTCLEYMIMRFLLQKGSSDLDDIREELHMPELAIGMLHRMANDGFIAESEFMAHAGNWYVTGNGRCGFVQFRHYMGFTQL